MQDDKRAIQVLLWTLKSLTNVRASMPLPCITTFLMVALEEGKGVCAYARAAGIHRAAMSRYLHEIGDKTRHGSPGLGLVAVEPHPVYPRRRQILLTDKGRSIAKEMFQQMKRANDGRHPRPARSNNRPPAAAA
jgi:hypothetical protein